MLRTGSQNEDPKTQSEEVRTAELKDANDMNPASRLKSMRTALSCAQGDLFWLNLASWTVRGSEINSSEK